MTSTSTYERTSAPIRLCGEARLLYCLSVEERMGVVLGRVCQSGQPLS